MKMKLLNKLTVLIFLLGVGFSCTDLEEDLTADFTEDFDPSNPGFGESENTNGTLPNDGLNAAYDRLRNGAASHESYFSVSEISTDEAVITQKGGDWFDGGIWLNMHTHDFRSTNPGIRNAWNNAYEGVFQCNDVLDGTLTDQGRAEIRAVRAFFYWKLQDMFGHRLKLQVTPGQDVLQNESQSAIVDFIESELLAAIPDLGTSRVYGRFNQYTAYALLARLYLNAPTYLGGTMTNATTGNSYYQDAIDAADMVINSGLYDLDPVFANVFAPDNVDNIEHIYVSVYGGEPGSTHVVKAKSSLGMVPPISGQNSSCKRQLCSGCCCCLAVTKTTLKSPLG